MALDSNNKLYEILLDVAKKVSMGDYDNVDNLMELTTRGKYPPQVSELAEAFGMMVVKIESREFNLQQLLEKIKSKNKKLEETLQRVQLLEGVQSHLSKFVPKSVQDIIEDNPENPDLNKHEKDLSVLFLDIAGYTKMSENISQEKMNYLIETYFSEFLNIIAENKGDINETAGDGLMILFQDENPRTHAVNAVSAAIGIQKKTLVINESLKKKYDPVMVNMGINSGKASVGSTRFKGVAGDRWTYTASGPVTNIAARVCSVSKGGEILVTSSTSRHIEDRFKLGSPREQALKNVSKPIQLREIIVE
ncbi:Adenylate cyclase, class 3 [Desulfocicer vacuolatum DSM 3385]|uniref:Adenylate cyclase, class 3 n=1 Tax=Desulfocicer vacuolatum DSM 3385 TaxID=1121400 RepID=A0A1W2CYX2_9BACT|nr:adenylate/guanylate cyclase domain-containing protein [Desulfocicer vacuolatum]SMC90370.1 Adenylate cyclase, class 3 [Desulfocicer vacuolatum DSM 3385]